MLFLINKQEAYFKSYNARIFYIFYNHLKLAEENIHVHCQKTPMQNINKTQTN